MSGTDNLERTVGSITAAGLYTAPVALNVTDTITATLGTAQGTASAVIGSNAPTNLSLSNSAIDENQSGGTIGTLSATDPDPGDDFTYAILNDPTGKFEIVGTTLRLLDGQSLNYEVTPMVDLLLRTTDSGGHDFDKTFTINVADLPETMTIGIGDWTASGLTLKLDGGRLHVCQTGTADDAVPPHNLANVLGIDVTGSNWSNIFTVDSLGSGIPLSVTNVTLTIVAATMPFLPTPR